MLHPVPQLPGPHLYCGPTAICAVTGQHPDRVLAAIRRVRGHSRQAPVEGVDTHEVCGALALLGYGYSCFQIKPKYQPITWGRCIATMNNWSGAAIVMLTGHYVAASYTEMIDNHTDGQPVPLSHCPHRRCHVHFIIEPYKLGKARTRGMC